MSEDREEGLLGGTLSLLGREREELEGGDLRKSQLLPDMAWKGRAGPGASHTQAPGRGRWAELCWELRDRRESETTWGGGASRERGGAVEIWKQGSGAWGLAGLRQVGRSAGLSRPAAGSAGSVILYTGGTPPSPGSANASGGMRMRRRSLQVSHTFSPF